RRVSDRRGCARDHRRGPSALARRPALPRVVAAPISSSRMPSVRAIRGRRRSTLCAAAALALVAFVVSSCGKDSNTDLSGSRASDLRASLDHVEDRVAQGDCTAAAQQAADFKRQVSALPSRVDRDLRDAPEGSATRLESLVSAQCKPAGVETTPAPEPPSTTDENTGGQQDKSEKDKK